MARKKKVETVAPDENFRTRTFMLEVYEDWTVNEDLGLRDFNDILQSIRSYDKYIGIRHDKDIWTYEDYNKIKDYCDDRGIKPEDPKKTHYHFIVKFDNSRFRNTLAKEIGMDSRFIYPVSIYRKAVEYLIHLNDSDKYLYSVDECFGSLVPDLKRYVQKTISEEDRSDEILDLILSRDRWTLLDFVRTINRNGLYSTFRSGWSIYKNILEDHNMGIY